MTAGCQAVHFAGSAYLGIASLTSADSDGYFAASVWFRFEEGNGDGVLWVADPAQYVNIANLNVGAGVFSLQFGLANADASNYFEENTDNATYAAWHHMLIGAKTTETAGNKIVAIFIDDVDVTNAFPDVGASFIPGFNGLSFYVCGDTFTNNMVGDVCDLWIAPNVNILTGTTISEATRRLFITAAGKPTDPSLWPATGAVRMTGGASTFATNAGTGGAFTLTGTLTDVEGPGGPCADAAVASGRRGAMRPARKTAFEGGKFFPVNGYGEPPKARPPEPDPPPPPPPKRDIPIPSTPGEVEAMASSLSLQAYYDMEYDNPELAEMLWPLLAKKML